MRFVPGCLVVLVLLGGRSSFAAESGAVPPVTQELVDALKSLKGADEKARQKVYDLISRKGDARLIPALKAFRDGSLQLRDGRLTVFGDRVNVEGKSVLPLVDAVTGQPVTGADGKPVYFARIDLSQAIKAPPRAEKVAVGETIDTLALLDPDPIVRMASIRDAGARVVRAIPDAADQERYVSALSAEVPGLKGAEASTAVKELAGLIDQAGSEKPASVVASAPSRATVTKLDAAIRAARDGAKPQAADALGRLARATATYQSRLDLREKGFDESTRTAAAIRRQTDGAPDRVRPALNEAIASFDLVLGDHPTQLAAAAKLGSVGTGNAASLLGRVLEAAHRAGDKQLESACQASLSRAERYQSTVRFLQNTFAGLSVGSILVLLALGLSIIFGLMGVINMAHGEFMMVGAFTTFVVSEIFKHLPPAFYDYYLVAAIPAAFCVSALIGLLCEVLIIRHLYGRPLETLLATWGVGLVLVQAVRSRFGDSLSLKPPSWMEGGWEIIPDLVLARNRVYIVAYCAICIAVVYFIVNRTKLGLLLRATTQNRQMASALGVPTRRIDALTFAFGAGLAGLAGVAMPLYNKINPGIGGEYIVDSFMVVVVGGVGTLAGAIWAGLGIGFLGKYLEPLLASIPAFASSSSVIGKVLVMLAVVLFLQWRPQGLFPPKGRMADA